MQKVNSTHITLMQFHLLLAQNTPEGVDNTNI